MNKELTHKIHQAYISADEKTLDNLWSQLSNTTLIKFFSGRYEGNINHNLIALKDHTMWLSSPHQFNDPFDCAMNIDYSAEALQEVQEFCFQTYGTKNLLDVFSQKAINSICRQITALKQQFLSPHNKAVEDTLFVSCFSEVSNLSSLRMWGHYANNHSGFCCEYPFTSIKDSCHYGCIPIKYSDTIFLNDRGINTKEQTEFILNLVYNKATEWSYEKEWRILSISDDHHGQAGYSIPFSTPNKIYMGCKIKEKLEKEIIEICKNNSIKLYKMHMVPGTYTIIPIEIKI